MSKQVIGHDMEVLIEKTLTSRKEKADKAILQVWNIMTEAAAQGKFECYIHDDNIVLAQETINALREQGFKVKVIYPEIDDWGNYYQGWVKISWKKQVNPIRKFIHNIFNI